MRVNSEIRVPRVRLIGADGQQVGIVTTDVAMGMAKEAGLDLVEISASSDPPVCKIMDVGKHRYDQTKKERENRKAQHQVKVKEVKIKPNIDEHDFETKVRHAREFVLKGNKVRVSCMFRGRELLRPETGQQVVERFCQQLEDMAVPESPPKLLGRTLSLVLTPGVKKQRTPISSP